ncbi:MAG: geranylgeranylglyceryl/heptaprenylglyceryl phosphate synthase [Methanobrevibacter sp.]|jgi:phosphoglycerol geranylgeranyltransferase|nr:geranylgeranylglyceryl/heptaprenylglyceryl phosphate synthase [Candidatus Methanoflexus mossambicus]
MTVEDTIKNILKSRKVHLTLIDPDEQKPDEAVKIAKLAIKAGSDGIMIGGSTVDTQQVDSTCFALSQAIDKPIIIFPGNTSNVSSHADAIFFMSFLNSNNPYWIIGAQALAAANVRKAGIEAIPMGYMVVEPGGTVGWVGDAKLVPRNKPKIPAAYLMAAETLGMRYFYLEAGSGADKHVPSKMIASCKKVNKKMVLVVGGGIRTADDAYEVAISGADVIVTGTVVEETDDVESKISEIIEAIRKAEK